MKHFFYSIFITLGCVASSVAMAAEDGPHTIDVHVTDSVIIDSNIPATPITFDVDDDNYGTSISQDFTFSVVTTSFAPDEHDVKLQLLPGSDEYNSTQTWVNLSGVPVTPDSPRIYYTIEYTPCSGQGAPPTYNLSDGSCPDHTCTIPYLYANVNACAAPGNIKITRKSLTEMPAGGTYTGTFTLIASEV